MFNFPTASVQKSSLPVQELPQFTTPSSNPDSISRACPAFTTAETPEPQDLSFLQMLQSDLIATGFHLQARMAATQEKNAKTAPSTPTHKQHEKAILAALMGFPRFDIGSQISPQTSHRKGLTNKLNGLPRHWHALCKEYESLCIRLREWPRGISGRALKTSCGR